MTYPLVGDVFFFVSILCSQAWWSSLRGLRITKNGIRNLLLEDVMGLMGLRCLVLIGYDEEGELLSVSVASMVLDKSPFCNNIVILFQSLLLSGWFVPFNIHVNVNVNVNVNCMLLVLFFLSFLFFCFSFYIFLLFHHLYPFLSFHSFFFLLLYAVPLYQIVPLWSCTCNWHG